MKSNCRYGSPKIHAELKKEGIKCSRPRVARIMSKACIYAKIRKAWKRTTKADKTARPADNQLAQNFKTDAPNKSGFLI